MAKCLIVSIDTPYVFIPILISLFLLANKKGKPFSFKLGAGDVIKGWDIGIVGLAVGGERRITIPAHLGYGSKGAPPDIPPNSKLIFDVKMLEIK